MCPEISPSHQAIWTTYFILLLLDLLGCLAVPAFSLALEYSVRLFGKFGSSKPLKNRSVMLPVGRSLTLTDGCLRNSQRPAWCGSFNYVAKSQTAKLHRIYVSVAQGKLSCNLAEEWQFVLIILTLPCHGFLLTIL